MAKKYPKSTENLQLPQDEMKHIIECKCGKQKEVDLWTVDNSVYSGCSNCGNKIKIQNSMVGTTIIKRHIGAKE